MKSEPDHTIKSAAGQARAEPVHTVDVLEPLAKKLQQAKPETAVPVSEAAKPVTRRPRDEPSNVPQPSALAQEASTLVPGGSDSITDVSKEVTQTLKPTSVEPKPLHKSPGTSKQTPEKPREGKYRSGHFFDSYSLMFFIFYLHAFIFSTFLQ